MMKAELAAFLGSLASVHTEDVLWGGGRTPLRVTTYLSQQQPPLEFVTSVRAIVLSARDEVIACNNKDGETHVVPGGRREPGETLEETLRREVLEETGWHISEATQLGIWHFHHLAAKLDNYRFPYPDFLHVIYRATAVQFEAEKRIDDDYEMGSRFVGVDELSKIRLEQPSQMLLVRHALCRNTD